MKATYSLPISNRPLPGPIAWLYENSFLIEAGSESEKTEITYRSGLRAFADWIQHFGKDGFTLNDEWPLSATKLQTSTLIEYRNWLLANRSVSTATTYMSAVNGYLHYLEGLDMKPVAVELGKLQRQLRKNRRRINMAESVVDLDRARQDIPKVVHYYEALPLPSQNDLYNRRLSLLRDRALVNMLYSTAARISEVVALNRSNVAHGRAQFATITGKGNKSRTLHIRDYAQISLQAYLKERSDNNPALFIAHSRNAKNARISTTSTHNIIKKAVKALKIESSLSAHDFRHFRATQLLREGMPLEVVQEFLGHADITTTRNIYAPVLGVHVVSEWLDNLDQSPKELAEPD